MTPLSIYDLAEPEVIRMFVSGKTIPVMEYTTRVIKEKTLIRIDGAVYPGPFRDLDLWKPLYQAVQDSVTEITELWVMNNLEVVADCVKQWPHKAGLMSLKSSIGLSDDGRPFVDVKCNPLSDVGKVFIPTSEGERARLMVLQMVGTFIDNLGKGD